MRISQDSSSWKAGGIIRRDFRHSHDGPEVPRYRAKRQSNKWCRRRAGVQHNFNERFERNHGFYTEVITRCSGCGKEQFAFDFFRNPITELEEYSRALAKENCVNGHSFVPVVEYTLGHPYHLRVCRGCGRTADHSFRSLEIFD